MIPGGRWAVPRVVSNTDNLEPAALYLYREWLPGSGEEHATSQSIASG
ncbi:GyrI-like domain-containing protein [Novosphingobium sp. SG720]|nr:GyrI-like domain-containing protein [Novosphingobium sp. SG720]